MTIALLTDIHGNREALEACLAHAKEHGATQYMFLGDYVGYGADPAWVVDTVMGFVQKGATALRGNHDEAAAGTEDVRLNADARVVAYTLEAENFESIHNHSAYAVIEHDKRVG